MANPTRCSVDAGACGTLVYRWLQLAICNCLFSRLTPLGVDGLVGAFGLHDGLAAGVPDAQPGHPEAVQQNTEADHDQGEPEGGGQAREGRRRWLLCLVYSRGVTVVGALQGQEG